MFAFRSRYVALLFEKKLKYIFTIPCLANTLEATTDDVNVFVELIFVYVILSRLFSSSKMIYIIHNPARPGGNAGQLRFEGRGSGRKGVENNNIIAVFVWREKARESDCYIRETRTYHPNNNSEEY